MMNILMSLARPTCQRNLNQWQPDGDEVEPTDSSNRFMSIIHAAATAFAWRVKLLVQQAVASRTARQNHQDDNSTLRRPILTPLCEPFQYANMLLGT